MNLKTFTARTMAEALAEVRRQLGTDAVILHTRNYQRGGFLGIGARTVVEVTAADGQEVGRQRRQASQRERQRQLAARSAATARGVSSLVGGAVSRSAMHDAPAAAVSSSAGDLIRRTYAAAKAELEAAQPPASRPQPEVAYVGGRAAVAGADPQQLAEEMRAVKRMVARMMTQQKSRPGSARSDLPDKLFDQYLALLEQEVAEELAGEVVEQVRGAMDAADLEDEKACRKAVLEAVAALLPAQAPEPVARADGRPRTIALVGPTGVGKTTTVAKLAATFKLKQKLKVGLITLDTYRIAAVDQLRTYAGIIGVPLRVVMSADELARAVEDYRGCDVVLIDTAGRSQRDDPRLEELAGFLAAARPHEVHLVLSSTCTQAVLMDTIERFSKIQADRIIFTKLDEAVTFGVVLNVMRKVRKRLSYITTGQEVPHQIEAGQPDRLAALVLGEGAIHS